MNLFRPEASYYNVGFFNTSPQVRNNRIAAVKKMLDAARLLGFIDRNHLEHLTGEKVHRTPSPATDEHLAEAVERAVDAVETSKGGDRVLALRNLAMLDWKSYGLRSCEMAWTTRGDYQRDPRFVRLRDSKTETGKRTMVVAPESATVTDAYLAALDAHRASKGLEPLPADAPLWIGQRGTGLSNSGISSALSALLPEGVRPHDLRARVGTALGKLRPDTDVGVALGITAAATHAYKAAGDAFGIMADVSELHARGSTLLVSPQSSAVTGRARHCLGRSRTVGCRLRSCRSWKRRTGAPSMTRSLQPEESPP